MRVELLTENNLVAIEPDTIRIGDVVDIPIWMDVWYGPIGLETDPCTFATFDRVIVLERGTKVSYGPTRRHRANDDKDILDLNGRTAYRGWLSKVKHTRRGLITYSTIEMSRDT